MKKNRFYMMSLIFVMLFCVDIGVAKADTFTLNFGPKTEKANVSISGAPSTDFNISSPMQCEINVVDDNASVTSCTYIGTSAYYNNTYSFVGSGKKNKINLNISNKKGKNNSLRMTKFSSSCKKKSKTSNHYTCTISNMTFKWEKHNECNNPDRSGNNNGIPGAVACVGGSSIFCDKYKNISDDSAKKECPGAYEENSNLTANDVLKKCETMDTAAFDKWCKYGAKKSVKNSEVYKKVVDASSKWGKEDFGVSSDGSITCTELLGDHNVELISRVLLVISIVGVILVVIFGISDFVKAIASSDDDALAQAFKRLKNRIISVVILLLLPALVDFALGFINENLHYEVVKSDGTVKEDVSIKVGKVSDCGQ